MSNTSIWEGWIPFRRKKMKRGNCRLISYSSITYESLYEFRFKALKKLEDCILKSFDRVASDSLVGGYSIRFRNLCSPALSKAVLQLCSADFS